MTWDYRVFREEDGDHGIREVFYDERGKILGCTQDAVEPLGKSLDDLAQELDLFQKALSMPVLTTGEVDAATQKGSERSPPKHKTVSRTELMKRLELDTEDVQRVPSW